MYCGICVEVCPFEALFWSPEYEYSEVHIADLLHDKSRLDQWMQTVPDPPAYEAGSEAKVKKVPR
jgi:NADH-quinone oxidoreductase subunit I